MERVRIVEVGPRDGLQNEAQAIPTATKLELIARLVAAGCQTIEATAFVSPKWVPQMADHDAVLRALQHEDVAYPVLTPNLKGFEAAVSAGVREIAVFAAASETFSQRNINCSIAESLARFAPVMEAAGQAGVKVRGYVSCALGCPYEGEIAPQAVARVAQDLTHMGCYEISLGDTIGVGVPKRVKALIACVTELVAVEKLAGHFHDTYGMGAANAWAAYQEGVRVFDASVAGLGGCPYAKGASGNVATEDLVWMFERSGVETGIDLRKLVDCAVWMSSQLGRPPASRVARALQG
ncbi:hydroxymethylglutaryl-CoA lyase [Rhodoblastus acidophilus]|uniref:hydroxymethylglutaryl-CoA lyase n=1 Tax=Rhodoblastus acidophilus TaxID=1074 RepID=UPI0022255227|nr:hydroxymethylglutaryl-CoA lyase [Rhodoblastus acidophilus]MCW2286555.1 hydroxymethylglutaryl-CoA lyase [Rhodoblastus acidophilus]MCW2335404.1 hydroxymethylglutaryl-CoA lyase [Rhodoblastus acidophilus]